MSHIPRDRTEKFYNHVHKLLHDGVTEFTGHEQSYEKWRKIFRNKISCTSPNADDGFRGRWLRSRIHEDVGLMAEDQWVRILTLLLFVVFIGQWVARI
jgi:hypothetical protein